MPSVYPTNLPTYSAFTTPITLQAMQHTTRHKQMEDDIVAIATRLGIIGSVDTASVEYRITACQTSISVLQSSMATAQSDIATLATLIANLRSGATAMASPQITSFVNAQHTHQDGANGGSLANGIITPNKLALGAAVADVATGQNTGSTSYTDLATVTDTVTVTIGANGIALVGIAAIMFNNTSGAFIEASFEVSGANTLSPAASRAIRYKTANAANDINLGTTFMLTGLNPGVTTFKMKYQVSAGTGTFSNRQIWVIPL